MKSEDTKKLVIPQYINFHMISAIVDTIDSTEGNFSTTLRVDLHCICRQQTNFFYDHATDLRKLPRGVKSQP